jgi:hypothetical protein
MPMRTLRRLSRGGLGSAANRRTLLERWQRAGAWGYPQPLGGGDHPRVNAVAPRSGGSAIDAYPVPGGHGGAAAVDTTTEDEDAEAAEALAVLRVGNRRPRQVFLPLYCAFICSTHPKGQF